MTSTTSNSVISFNNTTTTTTSINQTNATRVLVEKQLAALSVSSSTTGDSPSANKVRVATAVPVTVVQTKQSKQNAENVDMSMPPPYVHYVPPAAQNVPHQATPHTKVTTAVAAAGGNGSAPTQSTRQPKQLNFDQPTISSANKAVPQHTTSVAATRSTKTTKTATTTTSSNTPKSQPASKSPEFSTTVIYNYCCYCLVL